MFVTVLKRLGVIPLRNTIAEDEAIYYLKQNIDRKPGQK